MATSHLICVLDGLPVFFHGNFAQASYLLSELRLPSRRKCERAEVVRPLLQLRQRHGQMQSIGMKMNNIEGTRTPADSFQHQGVRCKRVGVGFALVYACLLAEAMRERGILH
jgi:hypothetical protein